LGAPRVEFGDQVKMTNGMGDFAIHNLNLA
jgi:hypothetical protein